MASANAFAHPGHHARHGHHSHRGGYFLGGLLLGSALAHSHHANPPKVYYVERRKLPPARTIYLESAEQDVQPVGRRLLRDLKGNCFELALDEEGNELRSQLPASECDW